MQESYLLNYVAAGTFCPDRCSRSEVSLGIKQECAVGERQLVAEPCWVAREQGHGSHMRLS